MGHPATAFEAYARVLRSVAETVPGYRIVDVGRPGALTLIFSAFGLPTLDRLLAPRLIEVEAPATIDAVEAEARSYGTAINWWLDPGAQPATLEALLLARGYERTRVYPVMSLGLEDLPAERAVNGVELGIVDDAERMRASQIVAGTGFGRPQAAVEAMADAMADPVVLADPCVAVVVAEADGRVVGTGTLWLAGNVAGILNVATLEEARGRGIATAVTLALLREAVQRGATLATLHASTQGFPIYLRMGFRHDGDVRVLRGPVA